MNNKQKLEQLIDNCLLHEASAEDVEALEARLKDDSGEAREEYLLACQVEGLLRARGAKSAPGTSALIPRRRSLFGRPATLLGIGSGLAALAASLLFLVSHFWKAPAPLVVATNQEPALQAEAAEHDPLVVGQVVRKVNCVWNDDAWSVSSNGRLVAGQTVRLERGFMEIELVNGVTIVLEGPGEFTALSPMRGILEYGAVAVRAPKGFEGYVVDTPSARLTDLGTEFGVLVNDKGVTDLFVFEGEVAVQKRKRSGKISPREELILKAESSWRSSKDIAGGDDKLRPSDFPDVLMLEDPPIQDPPALDVRDDLRLWFSGDHSLKTDGNGTVMAWGDLSSTDPSERCSAWQVESQRRPALVDNAINGHAALRFDGVDDCLVSEPLRTKDNQTIAVFASIDTDWDPETKPGKPPGSQIINYNGPPHLVLEHRFQRQSITARSYTRYENRHMDSGTIHAMGYSSPEFLAMIYVYNHALDRAELFVDGESKGVSQAVIPAASYSPKVIGFHRRLKYAGFKGDIAELMIYDRAVSQVEVDQLFGYFADRYGTSHAGRL